MKKITREFKIGCFVLAVLLIPAVLFTSGITLNTFKTYDTVETLDLDILRKRIILIFHWAEKLLG